MTPLSISEHPWSEETGELLDALEVDPDKGLESAEAARRLEQFGPNELERAEAISKLRILIAQFRGVLVVLLAAAAAISFTVGDWVEALAVLSVLAINAALGFATELRAALSMEALRKLGGTHAVVRRDGEQEVVDTRALVPGDIVVVEAGDRIGADMRVLNSAQLQADESSLTGESLPTEKNVDALPDSTFIGDRSCMLHSGTTLVAGSGLGVVCATGHQAEVGRIASMVARADADEITPLEKRLDRLGQTLVWVTLVIASLVAVVGITAGKPTVLILETAIALAVASVPEGLPILATMILARGVHRMSRNNALVQRLSAVETLGATGMICTDKTGTLTENRMTVDQLMSDSGVLEPGGARYEEALELASLCNNATLGKDGSEDSGDPLEVALLRAAEQAEVGGRLERVREVAFDPEARLMATVHRQGEGYLSAVKGAPEAVLAISKEKSSAQWLEQAHNMACKGLRVIAVARGHLDDPEEEVYRELEVVALVGLLDPPRIEVAGAIAACRGAGIDVCMMTGDHPDTAQHIAARVGIIDEEDGVTLTGAELASLNPEKEEDAERIDRTRVFARVSPEQKLDLVTFHQARGRVVAMTGDGVNDAPALRKADIGVAMGLRGTEVAREASEVVLLDDAFSSIVTAVREGRGIFVNIRAFVVYLLSCNLSEILVVGLATAVRAPLPILPLQILFLNLVTDVFPALALGANESEVTVMDQPPRSEEETILGRREWRRIVAYGCLITACVLFAFYYAIVVLELSASSSVSVAFMTLALAQLWHVFNMGPPQTKMLQGQVVRNPFVWGAVALCLVLLWIAMFWQPAASLLSLDPLGRTPLLLALGLSFVPLIVGVLVRVLGRRLRPS
jgi:Ca2+-transporting ATPase